MDRDLAEDLARNNDQAGRMAVRLFRFGQRAPGPARRLVALALRVVCGVDLPLSVQIGPGVRLAHGARGSVLHPDARIGRGATIYHGVTIGVGGNGDLECPIIGDDVYLGAGCCVLGGVTVGDGARVGANAVVLCDVPAGAAAVGVPARIVLPKQDQTPVAAMK